MLVVGEWWANWGRTEGDQLILTNNYIEAWHGVLKHHAMLFVGVTDHMQPVRNRVNVDLDVFGADRKSVV